MEMVYELLKITLPAIIAIYAVFLVVRSVLQKQLDEYALSIRQKNQEVVLPIRLQAYERICLLLERVTPTNIIPRLNQQGMTAKELQAALISEIRSEFNHNLSQQVYLSDDAWVYVSGAVERLVSLVNESGNELEEGASGFDLAKKILEKSVQNPSDTVSGALLFVKNEIREVF